MPRILKNSTIRLRSDRKTPFLTKCLKIYQCFTPHQTWLEKKISYKTDNALVLFSTRIENTKCTIGPKPFLIWNSIWIFFDLQLLIRVASPIISFIQKWSANWNYQEPQFCIQLVYQPHFGTRILLFGRFGKLRAKWIWVFLSSFWEFFFQLFVGIQMWLSNNFEPISKCVFSARHAIKSGRGKKRIEDTAKVIYPRFYKNSNERRV